MELDRVLAAIRAGMDANLAAATTKQIQLDLAAAESTVIAWEQQHRTVRSLSAADIGAALDHAGDLAAILRDAERDTRAQLYRTLGLELLLDPVGNRVEARLQLSGGGGALSSSSLFTRPDAQRLLCPVPVRSARRSDPPAREGRREPAIQPPR